jgi:hypothetical protein
VNQYPPSAKTTSSTIRKRLSISNVDAGVLRGEELGSGIRLNIFPYMNNDNDGMTKRNCLVLKRRKFNERHLWETTVFLEEIAKKETLRDMNQKL